MTNDDTCHLVFCFIHSEHVFSIYFPYLGFICRNMQVKASSFGYPTSWRDYITTLPMSISFFTTILCSKALRIIKINFIKLNSVVFMQLFQYQLQHVIQPLRKEPVFLMQIHSFYLVYIAFMLVIRSVWHFSTMQPKMWRNFTNMACFSMKGKNIWPQFHKKKYAYNLTWIALKLFNLYDCLINHQNFKI